MTDLLSSLGLSHERNAGVYAGKWIDRPEAAEVESRSPIDGSLIARSTLATPADYEAAVLTSQKAFELWRTRPAPARGEIVRRIGDALRVKKAALGELVTIEMGKSISEGLAYLRDIVAKV